MDPRLFSLCMYVCLYGVHRVTFTFNILHLVLVTECVCTQVTPGLSKFLNCERSEIQMFEHLETRMNRSYDLHYLNYI